MRFSPLRGWVRVSAFLVLLPLVVLALACEDSSSQKASTPAGTTLRPPTIPAGQPTIPEARLGPPSVAVRISQVTTNWKDAQQIFTLTLTNQGDREEKVHALVYARNEDIKPPRRAISPPTAYGWFDITRSRDGKLTAKDIERTWKDAAFHSARGGKLRTSWDATLKPGVPQKFEASHILDDTSPFAASKGKRLAKLGFTEYQVWLFTSDGQLFDEKTIPASEGRKPDPPATTRSTGKTPPDKSDDDPDEQAARTLRLAQYYLDSNRPERAREKLQSILDNYPKSAAAKKARALLRELDTK